jgi:hypothetical protein
MKEQDRYLSFVRWSEDDHLHVGYCPDLFPAGGVCHGATPPEAYRKLCAIIDDTVETARQKGLPLPPPRTRPMREVEIAA